MLLLYNIFLTLLSTMESCIQSAAGVSAVEPPSSEKDTTETHAQIQPDPDALQLQSKTSEGGQSRRDSNPVIVQELVEGQCVDVFGAKKWL